METKPDSSAFQESDEILAARFEISFDGMSYAFRQYHYDQFQDALRYAMAEHIKDGFRHDEAFHPNWNATYHPTDEEEGTMRLYGVVYSDRHYHYGGYRYSRLHDAVSYAKGHPGL